MNSRSIFRAIFCTVALSSALPAMAQSGFDWSGLYAGGTIGYGLGQSSHCDAQDCDGGGPDNPNADPEGFVGGLTFGYNIQRDTLVYGLEADISLSGMDGSSDGTASFGCGTTCDVSIDRFGTIRARVGVAQQNYLVFATAGVAFTHFDPSIGDSGNSETTTTPVVGAGMEYVFTPNITAKSEYLHVFSGDPFTFEPGDCSAPGCGLRDYDYGLLRVGVNYHF